MATPINTPFGTFIETSPGNFQAYASTAFGDFVQQPGGQWQAYTPPAATETPAATAPAVTQPAPSSSTTANAELCNGVQKPTDPLIPGYEWYCAGSEGWRTRQIPGYQAPGSTESLAPSPAAPAASTGTQPGATVTAPGGELVGTIIDAGPTFGKFIVSETGEYLPYAETFAGTFVKRPGEDWTVFTPPSTTTGRKTESPEDGRKTESPEEMLAKEREMDRAEAKRLRQESARAIIGDLLASYGLSSLTDYIYGEITKGDITNTSALVQLIRKRPEYAARFPGMAKRSAAGFNAISEQEYIDLEQSYRRTLRAAGLPAGFYDNQDDFANLIGGDVSVAEVGQRIQQGYQAVAQANPQVINEMRRLYGVDDSALAAYFLDPERATPILLRQAQAAQIAGQATLQAGREISAAQAEELAVAGVTQEQARQGFQTIGQAGELFVALPGTTEQAITEQEQIAGVFGTQAAAQQRLRQRQRERQAVFEAGGRFAAQGTTVTGLQ